MPTAPMPRAADRDRGFTLVELLVVVAVLGVLAAIAVPSMASFRTRGFDAALVADARNAATGQEAYFGDRLAYYSGNCASMPAVKVSPGVTCRTRPRGAGFRVRTRHPATAKRCRWATDTVPNLICG